MFEDVLRIPLMGYFSMSEVVLMHSDISDIGVFDLYIGQRHLDVKTHCFANSAGSELPRNSQDGWRL